MRITFIIDIILVMEKLPSTAQAIRNHAIAVPLNPPHKSLDMVRIGLEAAAVFDKFSTSDQAAFVSEYQHATGFPNMEVTASLIVSHFQKAIIEAAAALRTQIVFAGYDPTCSVAKGKALPGSDVDFMTVVVEEDDPHLSRQLYAETVTRLDPRIADMRSLTPYSIVNVNRLLVYEPDFLAPNGRYIMNAGIPWSPRLVDHEVATEIISQIQEGAILIDDLTTGLKGAFAGKKVQNFVDRHSINVGKEKNKYQERAKLCAEFPDLSTGEQFVIIRILQDVNEGIPLDLWISSKNPHSEILTQLVSKGILRYKSSLQRNQVVVPWIHDSENARVLRPGNWHPTEGTKVMSKWS